MNALDITVPEPRLLPPKVLLGVGLVGVAALLFTWAACDFSLSLLIGTTAAMVGHGARIVTHVSVILVGLSFAAVVTAPGFGTDRRQHDRPANWTGRSRQAQQPVFALVDGLPHATWSATFRDWAVMVHLTSWLWLCIGLGLTRLLAVAALPF